MPKQAKFPKTIHVTREQIGSEDEYLNVTDSSLENVDDGQEVAVYQLVEVGKASVKRTFEAKLIPPK